MGMIDYKAEAEKIALTFNFSPHQSATCRGAIESLCRRVAAEEREAAAGIAENIDHIACTQYMDSEATGKEIASCIRSRKEGR